MTKHKAKKESTALVDAIVKGFQEKKGHDIVVMDLSNLHNAIADHFVICHGDSTTQVEALADSVDEQVQKILGEKPWHKEGYDNAEWILIDYVNVVAHVFHKDMRSFYDLEKLWADAEFAYYKDAG